MLFSQCILRFPSRRAVTLWDLRKFHDYSICFSITSLKMFRDFKGSFGATNLFGMWRMGIWLETQQTLFFVPLMSAQAFCASSAAWVKGIPRHPQTPHGSNKASAEALKRNMLSVSVRFCFCNLLWPPRHTKGKAPDTKATLISSTWKFSCGG